jgi:hypothetical protein
MGEKYSPVKNQSHPGVASSTFFRVDRDKTIPAGLPVVPVRPAGIIETFKGDQMNSASTKEEIERKSRDEEKVLTPSQRFRIALEKHLNKKKKNS